MNIKIIGLGGIGSILCERLCRFLNYSQVDTNFNVTLIDGDEYEDKNLERQEFTRLGDKAEIKASDLKVKYLNLIIDYVIDYINADTISGVIKEKDIIFLCVDNHKTRMVVSNYCKTLNDVILISGGNELTDGNVQIFVRKGGVDLTPDLCAYHPEIANPSDRSPDEMSCEELSKSEPQLYFTNLSVATIMCWAYYNVVVQQNIKASEIYFDMSIMSVDAKTRIVK
jgi:molybdopterin/thiamine biosynthesis adenylyltransferase